MRLERSADLDISLELRHRELWLQSGVLEAMHLDDMARNLEVIFVLLFIEDDEEKIEARHDRSRDVHIVTQRLSPIVPTTQRVRCSQDRGSRIKSGMNASLGN